MDNFNLRKYLTENKLIKEQADHVAPMVAKAYRDYIKAKKDSVADVDFAEDPEKAYRYYSKKLNNTYSTRADRDAIEAILKKKYGSALEEQDTITKMTDFGPIDTPNTGKYLKRDITDVKRGDIIVHDETGKRYEVQDILSNGTKLTVVDTEGNRRVIYPYKYSIQNESLNEGLFMDVQDFNNKEYPHIHSWDETIDYNDMLSFAKDYAKYVATLAAQEFMDTDIPKEAIDEFLAKFNI